MTDYFSLLHQPRQPWLDEDQLAQAFRTQSNKFHPDRFHRSSDEEKLRAKEQASEINAAYACLRDMKSRLGHLIQLEKGCDPRDIQDIPHETTELFMQVGSLCRQVDQFLNGRAKPSSPLLQIAWFETAAEWRDKLSQQQCSLVNWREKLFEEIKCLNQAWLSLDIDDSLQKSNPNALMEKLEQIYRLLSYENRWSNQIQERMLKLIL